MEPTREHMSANYIILSSKNSNFFQFYLGLPKPRPLKSIISNVLPIAFSKFKANSWKRKIFCAEDFKFKLFSLLYHLFESFSFGDFKTEPGLLLSINIILT